MDEEKQITVNEKDEIIIPTSAVEQVEPGIFRIKPNDAFREWVKRQKAIKIV